MLCLFEDGNLAGRRSVRRQSLFYDLYPFREDAHIVTFANVHEIYMGNTNESANQRIVKWRLRFADSQIRCFGDSLFRLLTLPSRRKRRWIFPFASAV